MPMQNAPIHTTPDPPPLASPPLRVTIHDVDMPFGSMVVFIVKWAIASIPAALILMVIFGTLAALTAAMFASFFAPLFGRF